MKNRRTTLYAICYMPYAILVLILLCLILPQAKALAATYTLTVTANHGSVTVSPAKALYDEGEVVELMPRPDTGYYFTGWAGDAHGKRLVLNLTMNSDKTIIANFDTWRPPIGIPAPDFGIFETYRMYDDPAKRNPALTYTQNAEGGYYTHYVDNTHSNATDTSNPYGTPSKPRKTVPHYLPAGSVVEVHNSMGANNYDNREVNCTGVGTSSHPIFIRGVDTPRVPFAMDVGFAGDTTYMIVEGISFFSGMIPGRQGAFDTTYISIRNCDFHGDENNGGVSIGPWDSPQLNHVNHVVLYNNVIHDNGVWDPDLATGDRGIGGIQVQSNVSYIWALDNLSYHNEATGIEAIQGAGTPNASPYVSHHVYFGRNVSHHNKEYGFFTKTALDVIFSENVAYGHRPSTSSEGAGLAFQYDPKRVWFLYNTSYDNEIGIQCGSDSTGGRDEFYFIGNVLYDNANGFSLNDLNPVHPAELIGNTIYNSEHGIENGWYTCKLNIVNNIIAGISGYHISFAEYGTGANSNIKNTLFSQPVKINWDDTIYTSVASFQSGEGKGSGCIEGDPLFVDAANNDFRLQSTSPAIDAGIESDVYQRFSDLYGIDIRKDMEATTRPQSSAWDIGAYEYSPTSGTFLYGDVSGNGEISAYDAALTAQYSVGLISLTPDQIKAADVSGNSEVSAYDAALIAQKAVGLIEKFPVEG